jgi:hypothetical protein
MSAVMADLKMRGLSCVRVFAILLVPILAAPAARAQAPVTDYLAEKHYPAHVAAINFPDGQRLAAQHSITIGRWRVALKPSDPATYRSMRHHIKLVPWWGVQIHTFCHAIDSGQGRHCYFEFYERGAGEDCFLRMHHEGGQRDGTVDDIAIACPLSIEFQP